MGVQCLLDVVHQRAAALLRQADGHQTALRQHASGAEPAGIQQGEHLLGQGQLLLGQRAGLVELRLVVRPERRQAGIVGIGERHKRRIGIVAAELIDVVALAAVPPSGELGQIFGVVEVVLPWPLADDGDAGVAQHQLGCLVLRHHGQHQRQLLVAAVLFDGSESRAGVALRSQNGVVEHVLPLDAVADDKAARRLCEPGVQVVPPHQLHAQ